MANPAPGFSQYPQYQVEIEPQTCELVVCVNGTEIARSTQAVLVKETKHRDVWYIPFADVDTNNITPTQTETYCPFKGKASYWSITFGTQNIEDAIWVYQAPYDECAGIKNYASFYTNKVDVFVDGEPVNTAGPGRL